MAVVLNWCWKSGWTVSVGNCYDSVDNRWWWVWGRFWMDGQRYDRIRYDAIRVDPVPAHLIWSRFKRALCLLYAVHTMSDDACLARLNRYMSQSKKVLVSQGQSTPMYGICLNQVHPSKHREMCIKSGEIIAYQQTKHANAKKTKKDRVAASHISWWSPGWQPVNKEMQ